VVAVAGGTGGLGALITEELLKCKAFKVVVLSRDPSKCTSANVLKNSGAEFRKADYSNAQSLKEQLKGVEYLISALGTGATGDEQIRLADGAKAAGVSMFFPSEYGLDTGVAENAQMEILVPKVKVAEHCSKIGLKTIRVMSSGFTDTFFLPWFGCDFSNENVQVVGDGNQITTFTHRRDVARFICQIISDNIKDAIVRISSQDLTINDALKTYERLKNKKLNIQYERVEDTEKRIKASSDPMEKGISSIKLAIAKGRGYHPNALKPNGFKPISVEEYFKGL